MGSERETHFVTRDDRSFKVRREGLPSLVRYYFTDSGIPRYSSPFVPSDPPSPSILTDGGVECRHERTGESGLGVEESGLSDAVGSQDRGNLGRRYMVGTCTTQ